MPKLCVLTECVTQRSSGLLVTKMCQLAHSLNVANVQLVPIGSQQAVGEGALPALPCLGANWHTLVTRDMKCTSQLAHLGLQQHKIPCANWNISVPNNMKNHPVK